MQKQRKWLTELQETAEAITQRLLCRYEKMTGKAWAMVVSLWGESVLLVDTGCWSGNAELRLPEIRFPIHDPNYLRQMVGAAQAFSALTGLSLDPTKVERYDIEVGSTRSWIVLIAPPALGQANDRVEPLGTHQLGHSDTA